MSGFIRIIFLERRRDLYISFFRDLEIRTAGGALTEQIINAPKTIQLIADQKEYDKIMSWADLYAGSSIEGKKMILRQLIERVNIGKNFEIEVEFKISVTQFFDFLYPEGDKSVYYRAS